MGAERSKSVSSADLLQAEDEGLGTEDLVDLPGLAESLFDDVAVVVVVLKRAGSENTPLGSFLSDGSPAPNPIPPIASPSWDEAANLHVVFEDVGGGRHVHDVVDDQLAEGRQQVSPLVQRLDLVGFVLLVALYRQK